MNTLFLSFRFINGGRKKKGSNRFYRIRSLPLCDKAWTSLILWELFEINPILKIEQWLKTMRQIWLRSRFSKRCISKYMQSCWIRCERGRFVILLWKDGSTSTELCKWYVNGMLGQVIYLNNKGYFLKRSVVLQHSEDRPNWENHGWEMIEAKYRLTFVFL